MNFYWRRFRLEDIPLESNEKFDLWLRDRWNEKDALMEEYMSTGRFPSTPLQSDFADSKTVSYIETEVRTKYWWEFLQIFVVLGVFGLLGNVLSKIWFRLTHLFI